MRNWSRFIAGVLFGLVLATGVLAWAAGTSQTIEVLYNNIKLMVNGRIVQTSKEPFISDGTTYLPVRAVAEALGQNVQWDGATKTVIIGYRPTGDFFTDVLQPYSTTRVDKYWVNNDGSPNQMVMGGVRYNKGIQIDPYDPIAVMDYNLNGQFSRLTGKIGLDDLGRLSSGARLQVIIKGDGRELARREFEKGDLPNDIDISIDGVLRLSFEVTWTGDGWGALVDLVDLMVR